MAGLATAIKFGPLVITPSISNRQAKVGYSEKCADIKAEAIDVPTVFMIRAGVLR
jgi:hypothetical protein